MGDSVSYTEFLVVEEHLFQEIELESIVKLQFNEETLKKNFEVLIKILRDLKIGVSKSNEKSAQNERDISKLKEENARLSNGLSEAQKENSIQNDEIAALKERMSKSEAEQDKQKAELERANEQIAAQKEELAAQKQEVRELSKDNEKNKEDIAFLFDELNKLKATVAQLQHQLANLPSDSPLPAPVDNSGIIQQILDELAQIRENYVPMADYKEQCAVYNDEIAAIKDELARLKNGLNGLSGQAEQLASLLQRVKDLEAGLKDKVGYDAFEEEIRNLKMLIASLGSGNKDIQAPVFQQAGLSAREAALLKELDKRMGDLEEALRALRSDFSNHCDQYGEFATTTNSRLDKLEGMLADLAELRKLKDALEKLQKSHDKLSGQHTETSNLAHTNETKIKELRRLLEQLQQALASKGSSREVVITPSAPSGGVSEEYVEMRLRQLRDELLKGITGLKEELNDKASLQDLYKSEALILKKVDQVTEAILKKCADKSETKKALNYLEKKINQLFLLIQELKSAAGKASSEKRGEEDALISRRPLLWSCVSCDKGLDDYNGRLGDHKYWGVFPPKETTPERLGKFGKQFRFMQEKQMIREKMFDKQKITQTSQKFFNRFSNLPGSAGSDMMMTESGHQSELPNIHAKNP